MEKLIYRTTKAVRRTKDRAAKIAHKEMIRDRAETRQQLIAMRREELDAVRTEKKVRRELWELGALSPHADASRWGKKYGAWSQRIVSYPQVPEALRVKFWPVREGDRVCIMAGHESIRGRIGKITEINRECETVKVKDVNKRLVTTPNTRDETQPSTMIMSVEVPLKDVRLVYALPDPTTGIKRDVIINKLKREIHTNKKTGSRSWARVVHPQGIAIPWPASTPQLHFDYDGDTVRMYSERETFTPTLLGPPMPESVIDELRHKFSRFRTRHEDAYLAQKQAESDEAAARKAHAEALKPAGSRNIARQGHASVVEQGPRPFRLEDAIAARIGAHMAANGYGLRNGRVVPVAP